MTSYKQWMLSSVAATTLACTPVPEPQTHHNEGGDCAPLGTTVAADDTGSFGISADDAIAVVDGAQFPVRFEGTTEAPDEPNFDATLTVTVRAAGEPIEYTGGDPFCLDGLHVPVSVELEVDGLPAAAGEGRLLARGPDADQIWLSGGGSLEPTPAWLLDDALAWGCGGRLVEISKVTLGLGGTPTDDMVWSDTGEPIDTSWSAPGGAIGVSGSTRANGEGSCAGVVYFFSAI